MIFITDQNAFYLRVTAQTKAGSQMADVDLSVIKWLVAQFVRRGRSLQSMEIDSQGRAVIFNSGDLAMGVYGVEFNGYYNGQPWRFFEKKVFAIVDQTVNAVEQSGEINGIPVFDVTLTITLGGEGVPESYVTNAINEHDNDMNAHPYLQELIENAGEVDDVKVNGLSVVDENKEANINITATIDGNVGEPEVDVEQEDGEIRFAFRNMKGEKGETGAEGKQGPQGESFQPIEDVSGLVLAHTTGQDNTKAMSQKGVTDTVVEYSTVEESLSVSGYNDVQFGTNNGKWFASNNYKTSIVPVEPNTSYRIQAYEYNNRLGLLKDIDGIVDNGSVHFAGGNTDTMQMTAGDDYEIVTPGDCHYLIYYSVYNNTQRRLAQLKIRKSVADAIVTGNKSNDAVKVDMTGRIYNSYYTLTNTTIANYTDDNMQHCWFFRVKAGDKFAITGTNDSSANIRCAFSQVLPAVGVVLQNPVQFSGANINETITSPITGYAVINHAASVFADRDVTMAKPEGFSDIQEKAPIKTIMDVANAAGCNMAGIEPTSIKSKSINIWGDLIDPYSASYKTYEFDVQGETIYEVSGRITAEGKYAGYVFYDSDGVKLSYGVTTNGTARDFDEKVISPKGATLLRVSGNTEKGRLYGLASVSRQRTIMPKLEYEYIGVTNGEFGNINRILGTVATIRFIKVGGNFSVIMPISTNLRMFKYDDDFSYIGYEDFNVTADIPLEITVGHENYIKLMYADDMTEYETDMKIVRMQLSGNFPEKWDYYNVNEAGEHSQIVITWVNCTDPTSYIDDIDGEMTDEGDYFKCTNEVQDTGEYFVTCGLLTEDKAKLCERLFDYGRIILPPDYSNTDEPTRLILCCHGAGVEYRSTDEDFDAGDLEPEYWLAEGYAILDVEGTPFNNTDRHFYTPMSIECYISAYKWAINHFNIRRDGVFLTGRSMGGGNTFSLIRNECPIPIIAACPNVPCSPIYYWNYMNAERRTYNALAHGFKLPDGFSWTNNSPMTSAEWNVVKDNWDKWARFGLFGAITDLPSKDVMMANNMNINKDTLYDQDEDALYSSLHARIKCPVKIFAIKKDMICKWKRTALYWYKMLLNAGQLVEMRVFEGSDDLTGVQNHHADLLDPRLRCTVTTRYGEEMTNIPVVYVEMLKFWRRFEQE